MLIMIADDHALVREGLTGFIAAAHEDWTILQAASFDELSALLDTNPVEILSVDLQMPGMAGVASLTRLRAAHPAIKIVVLTATDERRVILDCLSAGVNGYVLKSGSTAELLVALDTVVAGGIYVPAMLSRVTQAATTTLTPPLGAQAATLTPRQHDVMVLLAQGLSTKMIARRLSLGVGTVKVHLAALYRALNVHTRTEAVVKSGTLATGTPWQGYAEGDRDASARYMIAS